MLRKLIWLFLCFPIGVSAHPSTPLRASIDSILQLSKEMQFETLNGLFEKIKQQDTSQVLSKLEKLKADFLDKKEPLLAQQCWSFQVIYRMDRLPILDTGRLVIARAALEETRKKGWKVAEAEWLFRIGFYFYERQQYGPAFEYFIHSYELGEKLGYAKYPQLAGTLVTIGLAYYGFGDYPTALNYFAEIIALRDHWPSAWSMTNVLNSTGLCFQQLTEYDSAVYYFSQASELARSISHDTVYAIIIDGNRAHAYQLMGKIDQAIPLFELDYQYNQRHGAIGSAVNASLALGSIYLKKNDMTRVEEYLSFAHTHINRNDLHPTQLYYELNAEVHRTKGDFAKALLFMDSSKMMKDTLAHLHDATVLSQAKQRVEVEQYMNELTVLEGQRKRQILIRDGMVIITLLLGIMGMLWFHRRYILRQKELKISELNQRIAEEQLESARNELNAFTKMLTEKNALLESVHEELTKAKTGEKIISDSVDLSTLMTRTILTEDDWQQFRILFEKVYPGFFFRMKEKFSDITAADIRLLALTKLHLSPKEMAAMLGISYDGIKKSRRRLRQRINLPEEGTLEEVVESI